MIDCPLKPLGKSEGFIVLKEKLNVLCRQRLGQCERTTLTEYGILCIWRTSRPADLHRLVFKTRLRHPFVVAKYEKFLWGDRNIYNENETVRLIS